MRSAVAVALVPAPPPMQGQAGSGKGGNAKKKKPKKAKAKMEAETKQEKGDRIEQGGDPASATPLALPEPQPPLSADGGGDLGHRWTQVDAVGEVPPTQSRTSAASGLHAPATPRSGAALRESESATVSEAEARACVAGLDTDCLRGLAQSLGGSGAGSRRALIAFCVEHRIGGPARSERGFVR